MEFTLDRAQRLAFAAANRRAMLLLHRAASDYLGARCCLLNGVLSGLELGSQAIEKHLKALLLFASPELNPKEFSHNIVRLSDRATRAGLVDLARHHETIQKFYGHFQSRYPDNPGGSTSASTGELAALDGLIIDLIEALPVPIEIRLSSGVYGRLAFLTGNSAFPDAQLLLKRNPALLAKLPSIVNDRERLASLALQPPQDSRAPLAD
ncbi:MAG: hypothetical protein Q7U99_24460 [Rubrivivax sp.]|nr:hypothetical protein [Rubrivivax sp.]